VVEFDTGDVIVVRASALLPQGDGTRLLKLVGDGTEYVSSPQHELTIPVIAEGTWALNQAAVKYAWERVRNQR
jgi:hypothetical protein